MYLKVTILCGYKFLRILNMMDLAGINFSDFNLIIHAIYLDSHVRQPCQLLLARVRTRIKAVDTHAKSRPRLLKKACLRKA